jgi:hypothetical protein
LLTLSCHALTADVVTSFVQLFFVSLDRFFVLVAVLCVATRDLLFLAIWFMSAGASDAMEISSFDGDAKSHAGIGLSRPDVSNLLNAVPSKFVFRHGLGALGRVFSPLLVRGPVGLRGTGQGGTLQEIGKSGLLDVDSKSRLTTSVPCKSTTSTAVSASRCDTCEAPSSDTLSASSASGAAGDYQSLTLQLLRVLGLTVLFVWGHAFRVLGGFCGVLRFLAFCVFCLFSVCLGFVWGLRYRFFPPRGLMKGTPRVFLSFFFHSMKVVFSLLVSLCTSRRVITECLFTSFL